MKMQNPKFVELVRRLQAAEITRAQAAEEWGVKVTLMNTWLSRAGVNKTIPDQRKVNPQGGGLGASPLTPERRAALEEAVQRVYAGEISALAAAKANPDINHRTLADKVRKLRVQMGVVVQSRSSPVAHK